MGYKNLILLTKMGLINLKHFGDSFCFDFNSNLFLDITPCLYVRSVSIFLIISLAACRCLWRQNENNPWGHNGLAS